VAGYQFLMEPKVANMYRLMWEKMFTWHSVPH
jgi:hypothetical protein